MTENERIHNALAAIIQATSSSGAKWIVGGSVGLMLRGLPLSAEPRDLDIYCDDEDVESLFEALASYAIDRPVLSSTDIYRSTLSHFRIHDVQVELVGGFRVTASGCRYETEVSKLLLPYGILASIANLQLAVPIVPLAHELWFNWLRNRDDRVRLIARAFAEAPGLHEEALRAIEAGNLFTEGAKRSIRRLIDDGEAGGCNER